MGLLIQLLLSVSTAMGATYYVDPTTGNDSNVGTSQSAPWRTIPGTQTAVNSGLISARWGSIDGVNKLNAGDIVEIKAGAIFSGSNSGRVEITSAFYSGGATPVTVRCSSVWGIGDCMWDGTGMTLPDNSYPILYIQASNFTLTGSDLSRRIIVQKTNGYGILVQPSWGNPHSQKIQLNFIRVTQTSGFGSVDFSNTDNGGMDNFEIDNNSYNGLTVGGGSDANTINLLFQNGKLHHNGLKSENVSIRQGNGAVAVGATNLTFRKVLAYNNQQDGFDNGSSGNNTACTANFDSVAAYDNGEDGIGANGGPNGSNL